MKDLMATFMIVATSHDGFFRTCFGPYDTAEEAERDIDNSTVKDLPSHFLTVEDMYPKEDWRRYYVPPTH